MEEKKYTLIIKRNGEEVERLNVQELDVLKMYFNTKEGCCDNLRKRLSVNCDSVGTIKNMKVKWNTEESYAAGLEYCYELKKDAAEDGKKIPVLCHVLKYTEKQYHHSYYKGILLNNKNEVIKTINAGTAGSGYIREEVENYCEEIGCDKLDRMYYVEFAVNRKQYHEEANY